MVTTMMSHDTNKSVNYGNITYSFNKNKMTRCILNKSINVTMKEPIYKVSCIVTGSKCAVMRSTSQLVDVAAFVR